MADRRTSVQTIHAAGTMSGSSNSSGILVGAFQELSLYFDTTALSAGATLDVVIQDSPDNSEYYAVASVTQITATGNTAHRLSTSIGEYIRLNYTVSGTWTGAIKMVLKT